MARLTADTWLAARQSWEADPTLTFEALAERLGITRQAVGKMAAKQEWVQAGQLDRINRAAQIRADGAEVAGKVADKVAAETTKKGTAPATRFDAHFDTAQRGAQPKPLPASVDQSTELRSRLIQTHRGEWRKHAGLYPLEAIKADFDTGKSAKISAEMLAIRHKAERTAWGMDDDASTAIIELKNPWTRYG